MLPRSRDPTSVSSTRNANFHKNCSRQLAFRLRETRNSKIKWCLVYAKRYSFENRACRLHETPTLGGGSRHRGSGWMGPGLPPHSVKRRLVYAERTLSQNCSRQRAFRLRETHVFKIEHRPVYAKRYFFNKLPSRLRETTTLGANAAEKS